MDTAQIDTTITLLAAVAHAVEYTAVIVFLVVAGYSAAMHASALLFALLRAVLAFARECTVHMLVKLRPLLDEARMWPTDIRAALRSDPQDSHGAPNQPDPP